MEKRHGVALVQHAGLSAENEILLLLYDAGVSGMTLAQLTKSIPKHRKTIGNALTAIVRARLATRKTAKQWILTDNGRRTVETTLSGTLTI